jgi:hypothetical protein
MSVIFRRIGGRIIPIIKEHGPSIAHRAVNTALGAIGGAAFGLEGAAIEGAVRGTHNKVVFGLNTNTVNTKAFVKKQREFKNVEVVTGLKDLYHNKKIPLFSKIALIAPMLSVRKGKNAFATRIGKVELIGAHKKTNPAAIGHELGHIKDFRKNGVPGAIKYGLPGMISGHQYDIESRAWKLSPHKKLNSQQKELKSVALGSYATARRWTRIGAVTGAIFANIK